MASTKEKMQKAQQLIKEKRYDEARAILRTVDHDKAYEWLDRLDKIAPVKKDESPAIDARPASIASKSKAKSRIKSKTVTVSSKALFGKSQMDKALEKYQNEGWQLVSQSPSNTKNTQILRFEYEMSDEEIAAEARQNRYKLIGSVVLFLACGICSVFASTQGQRIQAATETQEAIAEDTQVAVNVATEIVRMTKNADATATATLWTAAPTFTPSITPTITPTATLTVPPTATYTRTPTFTPIPPTPIPPVVFSSSDLGLQPVIGPVDIPSGLYEVTVTTNGFFIGNLETVDGQCVTSGLGFFNLSQGEANDGAETLFGSENCRAFIQVSNTQSAWSLEFRALSVADVHSVRPLYSSVEEGLHAVIGPISFEDGRYRVTATTNGFMIASLDVIDGSCDAGFLGLFNLSQGQATSGAQNLMTVRDCLAMLVISNTQQPWTLAFEYLG